MSKVFIGIDNGATGTIGIISPAKVTGPDLTMLVHTPAKEEQDYQTSKKKIRRLNYCQFKEFIGAFKDEDVTVVMERPMVNPTRFTASASALRCHEAELIAIEELGLKHMFIDSKEWQKELLPKGIKGSAELKRASKDIGTRLFPELAKNFKHPDMDGILIAEYARRRDL